jgi:hypothetical protein
MTNLSEEKLAELIELVPPAPQGWVEAAIELPRVRAAIDELTTRAVADRQIRQAILADLEEALRTTGVEPRPKLLETLRARLTRLD